MEDGMVSQKSRTFSFLILALAGSLAVSLLISAQPSAKPIVRFTATSDNVGGAGQTVRIELFAWSTDAERDQFAKAWTSPVQPVQAAAVTEQAARGGRGGNQPAVAAADAPPPAAARGGRGGRGGRGNRGAEAPPPPVIPLTPTTSLAGALQKAASVGMLWTSETVGYAIRYAYRFPQPDGGERIVLATDRRLGAWNAFWKPVTPPTSAPPDYPFSVIELRLNASGLGEGKASLISPITVDNGSKSIELVNYATLPVVLKGVKRQNVK
jgi:hypothetical protein